MTEATEMVRLSRREAIRRVSALLGGVAFIGGSRLLAALEKAGNAPEGAVGSFTLADIALLDEIAETILPATKTPGAKAAKTGAFMALMVTDSYWPAQQAVFRDGMNQVNAATARAHGVEFMAATPSQRLAVLTALDHEQKLAMDAQAASGQKPGIDASSHPAHYFRMMKELALLGYFTSEVGCTQALRYVEAPGRFDACIPYTPGQPAWALHA